MWQENPLFLFLKYFFQDLLGDFFYFPIWWYTKGLKKAIIFTGEKIKDAENLLAVRIWIKNLFRPMYAQYDWQGRIISFFMRIFQIIVRSLLLVVLVFFILFIPLIWFFLPLVILGEIIFILAR